MSNKTALVVVVYNQWCGNSLTCKTINEGTRTPDIILIIDNSTKELNNRQYCEAQGWMYHSMGGNAGLTKAYNAALGILKKEADFVIWADDDTSFSGDYLEKLLEYTSDNPEKDVFLPVVKSNDKMLSPAIYTKRRMMAAKTLADLENRQITAINSGMAVRLSLYDNYRYDEAMFLDYVDHDFMCWCNLNGKLIQIMADVLLLQSFFDDGNPSVAARKNRLRIFCRDFRIFGAKNGKHRLATEYDLLKYCVKQYLKMLKTWLTSKHTK